MQGAWLAGVEKARLHLGVRRHCGRCAERQPRGGRAPAAALGPSRAARLQGLGREPPAHQPAARSTTSSSAVELAKANQNIAELRRQLASFTHDAVVRASQAASSQQIFQVLPASTVLTDSPAIFALTF